jgi:hypothetical protein
VNLNLPFVPPFLGVALLAEMLAQAVLIIVYGLPVIAYAIPLLWGLIVLGHKSNWSPRADNIVCPVILIVGWFLATGIVFVWAWMVIKVQHVVFGGP